MSNVRAKKMATHKIRLVFLLVVEAALIAF